MPPAVSNACPPAMPVADDQVVREGGRPRPDQPHAGGPVAADRVVADEQFVLGGGELAVRDVDQEVQFLAGGSPVVAQGRVPGAGQDVDAAEPVLGDQVVADLPDDGPGVRQPLRGGQRDAVPVVADEGVVGDLHVEDGVAGGVQLQARPAVVLDLVVAEGEVEPLAAAAHVGGDAGDEVVEDEVVVDHEVLHRRPGLPGDDDAAGVVEHRVALQLRRGGVADRQPGDRAVAGRDDLDAVPGDVPGADHVDGVDVRVGVLDDLRGRLEHAPVGHAVDHVLVDDGLREETPRRRSARRSRRPGRGSAGRPGRRRAGRR